MIEVSVEPTRLVVDQPNDLIIRLTNIGHGSCTNIVLRLALPVQVVLLHGLDRIEVARLGGGQSVAHTLRIRPKRIGLCTLTSANFSYCDALGWSQRINDLRLEVAVVAATPSPATSAPAIELMLETVELPLNEWEVLKGQITNVGPTDLRQIAVRINGPIVAASTWTASGPIRIGETVDFYISVRAQERGSKVPIRIDATFTDVAGRTDRREQLNLIRVGAFTTAGTMEPKLGQVLPTEGGAENLRKLIYQYNRRLQKLQEQAALQGMSVDPSVTIEIEDINAKIAELQTKLDA